MSRCSRRNIVAEVMNEHIPRIWAYRWYVKLGMSQDPRDRFASADWAAFGLDKRATDEPLTDLTQPWVVEVLRRLEAGV